MKDTKKREREIKGKGDRAGTCVLQCLSYSANRCGTFHTVTMVSAEKRRVLSGVERGDVKKSVWECVCFSCVIKKSVKRENVQRLG